MSGPADTIWQATRAARTIILNETRNRVDQSFSIEVVVSPIDRLMQGPARVMLVVRPASGFVRDRFLVRESEFANPEEWVADLRDWLQMVNHRRP